MLNFTLTKQELEPFVTKLKHRGFHYKKAGAIHLYYYTGDGLHKIHFVIKPDTPYVSRATGYLVNLHVDDISPSGHRVNRDPKLFTRVLQWLNIGEVIKK